VISTDVRSPDIILPNHRIPQVKAKVRSVLQQPLSMTIRIRIRSRVSRVLAHAVLAPDGEGGRCFCVVDASSIVAGECIDAGLEVREQPGGDLGAVAIAEEADGVEPAMEGDGEGLDC
jgi:hypothetical protein